MGPGVRPLHVGEAGEEGLEQGQGGEDGAQGLEYGQEGDVVRREKDRGQFSNKGAKTTIEL